MIFHSVRNAPIRSDDAIFRESWRNKAAGVIVLAAILFVAPLVSAWYHHWRIAAMFGLLGVFVLQVFVTTLRHTFHRSNWLVRCQPTRMLIKFRSYLNDHFPDEDLVVVELRPEEIEWVRSTKELRLQPGSDSGTMQVFSTYLDIKPSDIYLAELELRLKEERARPPIGRWVQSKAHDYPVRIIENGIIRITWRDPASWITPPVRKAVDHFAASMKLQVHPERSERLDLVTDPRAQAKQEAMILELIESGNTISAVSLTRKLYGYSLTDARRFVEELSGR